MIVRGVRIKVHDAGQGEAVLFLHGWGSEFSVFQPFLDDLSGNFRALALDLPGFGGSAPPTGAWAVDDYADFVLDFLAELDVARAVVIGHSFGGRIAIKLAARRKERLEIGKMILIGAAGIKAKKSAAALLRQCLYKAGRSVLSLDPVRRAFPGALERWRRARASADYLNATPLMREVLLKAVNEDLTPCLSGIGCPTLLVWGERDAAVPVSDAKIMAARIPDSGLAVLPGAGHYPFLDRARSFGLILASFLGLER